MAPPLSVFSIYEGNRNGDQSALQHSTPLGVVDCTGAGKHWRIDVDLHASAPISGSIESDCATTCMYRFVSLSRTTFASATRFFLLLLKELLESPDAFSHS